MQPHLHENRNGLLRIWDHPVDNTEYVIGIDVAEGRKKDRSASERRGMASYSDSRPDYSAMIVIELESSQHVATWHGYIPPDALATIAAALGFYYNTALLVPEINGPGIAVITRLAETIQYPNIYRSRVFNVLDRDPHNPALGWRTDAHSRKILMVRIHEMLASDSIFTRDRMLISELRTMEFDDQGTERARGRNKDDCVLAFSMALQGRYESIGATGRKVEKLKITDREAMDKAVWDKVKLKQEAHEHRRTGRLFTGWAPRARSSERR